MKLAERIKAWMQLLRVPNMFTVPGDPIAGFLLSGGVAVNGFPHVLPVVLSSICLYGFGLISNDIADLKVDRSERPARPLPSGRISIAAARAAALFLLVWGVAMAWFTGIDAGVVSLALAFAVICYNILLKNRRIAGPVSMGACRGLSVLMGAAAGGGVDYRVAIAIAGVTFYVAGFSAVARGEMKKAAVGLIRWLPAVVLVMLFFALFLVSINSSMEPAMLIKASFPALLAVALALLCGRRARSGSDIPGVIGGFIANMMLVQAALCTLSGAEGQIAGALIGSMIPLFLIFSMKFYSS